MPTTPSPDVLADPIGVMTDLITKYDPTLDRGTLADIVTGVAGGRAKRRRLAQALLNRPSILTDGRSPAPRAIADLLITLREAGATKISAPVCAQCGKHLRTFQRRGEDWYCAVCGPRREPCAACGQTRPVNMRDREGQPRCAHCPPDDGRDPVDLVVSIVAGVDPSLPADVVAAAARTAAPRAGQRYQLAWALADRPDLLTGAGAEAPIPSVLRLIDGLGETGAQTIIRPACPDCGRVIHLHRPIGGRWLCRNCTAKSRAQPCSRCGAVREAATRDEYGAPLCPNCLITDPSNQETCVQCHRVRPVCSRTPDGPLCGSCQPQKTMTCGICGREASCVISAATGEPWCFACKQRWARCTGCGKTRRIRSGTLDEPRCATCTPTEPGFWRECPGCGQPRRINARRCARCTLAQRLRDLFGDEHGQIRPELAALHHALAATERPTTVVSWLDRSTAPTILRALVTGDRPLTHDALDELPAGKPVEHLRSVLVNIGTLPRRDEHMIRLQRWTNGVITERADPDERKLLHRYAVWHVIRRLRSRLGDADTTHDQAVAAQRNIRAAMVLLDWLTARQLTLTTARQGDLEAWLASPETTHRVDGGNFIRWAHKEKLTRLDFAAVKWGGPSGIIDTETRWEQARWLLHDDSVKPDDRVAGLLVLLYAQWPATISRLTLDQVHIDNDVSLRLGREPVVLPEPLAGLVRHLTASRRGHAAIGDSGASPWLFPGGQPGRPISAYRLAERLRELGIRSAQSRSSALFQLATDLPAAVLAKMLGIHISVAVAWQRASSGDWAVYAAEVSRRPQYQEHEFAAGSQDRDNPSA
jgi:hypothetical protein